MASKTTRRSEKKKLILLKNSTVLQQEREKKDDFERQMRLLNGEKDFDKNYSQYEFSETEHDPFAPETTEMISKCA